ncbi:MAG: hypothetical protein FWC50_02945 [Planctomycetaceae bacterium]|nr:hypothetical protein [Planctomycetaceae bacterium]
MKKTVDMFWKLMMISGPLFLAGWIVLLFWIVPVFGTIDAEHATRDKLVNWFLFRDFRSVPEEKRDALAECYLKEFGFPAQKKPKFVVSAPVKYQVRKIEAARRERVQQELKVLREPEKLLEIQVPMHERNAKLLAKAWLLKQAAKWDNASFADKKAVMNEMITEIKWWQDINAIYLATCDVVPSSPIESIQDLDTMFARWEAESPPELAARFRKLKTQLVAGMVSDGLNNALGGEINSFWNNMKQ